MKPLLFGILVVFALPWITESKREDLSRGITNYKTEGSERHEELEADGTIKGHYSYVDPTGKQIRVSYSAGKDGFQATGNHFAEFNMGPSGGGSEVIAHADEDDDSYDDEAHTYYHEDKPTYHDKKPKFNKLSSHRPTLKPATSYANQENTNYGDDSSSDSHYKTPSKPSLFRTSAKPGTSYVNQENTHYHDDSSSDSHYNSPIKHYQSDTSSKYQTAAPTSYEIPKQYYQSDTSSKYQANTVAPTSYETPKHYYQSDTSTKYQSNTVAPTSYDVPSYHYESDTSSKYQSNTAVPTSYSNNNQGPNSHYHSDIGSSSYSSGKSTPASLYHSDSSSHFELDSPKYQKKNIATSHVLRENEHYSSGHYDDDDEEEIEKEHHTVRPTAASYTFRPSVTRSYPSKRPTYNFIKEETPSEIHTQFNIKHPSPLAQPALEDLEDDEEYVAIPTPKKSNKTPVKFPNLNLKTTYSYTTDDEIESKPYESGDHLNSFDTTKLLDDYHKNQPSISKLPTYSTTKFTIDDVADSPYKLSKYPSDFGQQHKLQSSKPTPIHIKEFQPSYKLQDGNLYTVDESSNKDIQKLLEQQEHFSDDHVRLQLANNKTPASIGQYQQYLKSQEDEQIEQQFLREQLKLQEKQKRRPIPYVRPFNKFHPGRRPPKRPSNIGTYRTTIKIPYGFHLNL